MTASPGDSGDAADVVLASQFSTMNHARVVHCLGLSAFVGGTAPWHPIGTDPLKSFWPPCSHPVHEELIISGHCWCRELWRAVSHL